MARTSLTVVHLTRFAFTRLTSLTAGTAIDAANGNYAINDGATFLWLANTDGANSHTVSVSLPSNVDGSHTVTPQSYTIPASQSGMTGAFPIAYYSDQLLVDCTSALVKVTPYSLALLP